MLLGMRMRMRMRMVLGGGVIVIQRVAMHHDDSPLTSVTSSTDEQRQQRPVHPAVVEGDATGQ